MAERAGTSQPVISTYERGHRDPTVGTLRRLIEASGEQLVVDAVLPQPDLAPPGSLEERGRRLVEVLSLADAVPARRHSTVLRAPRLVSR